MLENTYKGQGLTLSVLADMPDPSASADAPRALLQRCPVAAMTPLLDCPDLAARLGCATLHVKDERPRMGLGSFKALGAAYAIAAQVPDGVDHKDALEGRVFVAASAGNHGLSVAAGARVFGARAIIYLSDTVPEAFADLLRSKGAEVVRAGTIYEESMAAAARDAAAEGWTLLSDSSWPGYSAPAHAVMEGYTVLAEEVVEQIQQPPSLILLQAGVGGMAAALAAVFRAAWGAGPRIVVVEPDAAPALHDSIVAGGPVDSEGPVSNMGRLDCKTPSLIALKGLARDADAFALVSDAEVEAEMTSLRDAGLATSPSGGAGLAALLAGRVPVSAQDRVLCILSEGPV